MTAPVGRPPLGRPGHGQSALDGLDVAGVAELTAGGAVVAAVTAAIERAGDAGDLDGLDVALSALALKVAKAVDLADARCDTRGVVSASRELQALLGQLGLTHPGRGRPASREDRADDVAGFLAELGTPTVGDPANP